jgi:hypothetical protein
MFLNRGKHVDVTDYLAEGKGELLFLFDTKYSERRIILAGEMHGLSLNSSQGCIRPGICVYFMISAH